MCSKGWLTYPTPKAKLSPSWYSNIPSSKQHEYECSITRTSTLTNENGHQQSTVHMLQPRLSASDFMVQLVNFTANAKFKAFATIELFSFVCACVTFVSSWLPAPYLLT